MSEIEAAVLRARLLRLEAGNARRRAIADRCPDHVQHLCVARVADRDAFRARVRVPTEVHHPRAVHDPPAYRHFVRRPGQEERAWAAAVGRMAGP